MGMIFTKKRIANPGNVPKNNALKQNVGNPNKEIGAKMAMGTAYIYKI